MKDTVREILHIAVDLAVCVMVALMFGVVVRLESTADSSGPWRREVSERLLEQGTRIGKIEAHVESLRLRAEQAVAAAEQARKSVPEVAEAAAEKAAEKVVEAVGASDGR